MLELDVLQGISDLAYKLAVLCFFVMFNAYLTHQIIWDILKKLIEKFMKSLKYLIIGKSLNAVSNPE